MKRGLEKLAFWRKNRKKTPKERELKETVDLTGINWQDGAPSTSKKRSKWWPFGKKNDEEESEDWHSFDWETKTSWDDSTHPNLRAIQKAPTTEKPRTIKRGAKPSIPHPELGIIEESEEKNSTSSKDVESHFVEQTEKIANKLFLPLFIGATILFSLPLWRITWLPLQEAHAHLALASLIKSHQTTPFLQKLFAIDPSLFAGSLSSYLIFLLSQFLTPHTLFRLLSQFYLLMTPLLFLPLLRALDRSKWNIFFLFFFLYNGMFLQGDLDLFLSFPLFLWGIASFYLWIVKEKSLSLLSFFLAAWALLLLQLPLFIILLLFSFFMIFFLARSVGERFGHLLLLLLGALPFGIWLFFFFQNDIASTISPIVYEGYKKRLEFLPTNVSLLFSSSSYLLWLLLLGILLLLGLFLRDYSHPKNEKFSVRYFGLIGLFISTVLFLGLPSQMFGHAIPHHFFFALAPIFLLLCLDIRWTTPLTPLLIISLLVTLLFGGFFIQRSLGEYSEEVASLPSLIEVIPPRKRLLVWQIGYATTYPLSFEEIGGLYMAQKSGLSNINFSRWQGHFIHLRRGKKLPRSDEKRLPQLRKWDYLLTRKKVRRRGVIIQAVEGPFRLYKIVRKKRVKGRN